MERVGSKFQMEYVPIGKLKPDPFNPRRMPEGEMEALTRSIQEFGMVDPLIVRREDHTVIGGHQRLLAAKRLGYREVPAILVDVGPEEAKVLNLALNRISGGWDTELLARLFQELEAANSDITLSGFGQEEIADYLKTLERQERKRKLEAFDAEAALADARRAEPKTNPGDLYILGDNRLLCGDATNPEDMARLMGDEKASLVATDPPYGVALAPAGHKHRPIANDDLEGEELLSFLTKAFTSAAVHTAEDASWYVWHASTTRPFFLKALAAAGVTTHQELIWVKESFQLGRSDYHWQHEACLYGWGKKHRFLGGRDQSTVWEVERDESMGHPTTKPVELYARAMRNHLKCGEVALDMFLGSGTALIAAEKEGCRCFGMELDAVYCDIVVARWEAFTGEKAIVQPG